MYNSAVRTLVLIGTKRSVRMHDDAYIWPDLWSILTVLREWLREQKVAVFVFIRPYSVTGTATGAEFYVLYDS